MIRDITKHGARRNNYPKDNFGREYQDYPSVIAFNYADDGLTEVGFAAVGYASEADFNNGLQPLPELRRHYPLMGTEAVEFINDNRSVFDAIIETGLEIAGVDNTWKLTHLAVNAGTRELLVRVEKINSETGGRQVKTLQFFGEDYQAEIDKTDERRMFAFQVITLAWTQILTVDPETWSASTEIN